MIVFDASALLAYLRGEDGAEVVEQALDKGGACGAANWSEVAQRSSRAAGTGHSHGLCFSTTDYESSRSPAGMRSGRPRDGARVNGCRWATGCAWPLAIGSAPIFGPRTQHGEPAPAFARSADRHRSTER